MTSHNLFTIIIKILGLIFLKDLLWSVVATIGSAPVILGEDGLLMFILMLLTFGIYALVAYVLLFKSEKIISILKLTQGINEEVNINLHRSTLLAIALIILGGYLTVIEIPDLIYNIYNYFQGRVITRGAIDISLKPIVFSLIRLFIGLLIVGNQRQIVNYLEYRRRV